MALAHDPHSVRSPPTNEAQAAAIVGKDLECTAYFYAPVDNIVSTKNIL